jgi:NADPH:quinone reductase-like Zn-dependent oxidoreductase
MSFNDGFGAWAERVVVDPRSLGAMPEGLTFEEAATLPLAGLTALEATRDVRAGEEVLVQGAGGGVGMLTVQLAQAKGARVTAVCGKKSVHILASLGAARVIDYTQADFTSESTRYDLILGVNGYHALGDYKRSLKPDGRYAMVGGDNAQIFGALLYGKLSFAGSGKRASIIALDPSRLQEDLEALRLLVVQKKLRPIVDRVFPLDAIADAVGYVERGDARGKVALQISFHA